MSTSPETITKIKPKEDIKPPPYYNVIYMNDEITTAEFVVETLVIVFGYTRNHASEITQSIHENGSAVVATLPFEMAEQKGVEVTQLARNNNFPLIIKLEPEQ